MCQNRSLQVTLISFVGEKNVVAREYNYVFYQIYLTMEFIKLYFLRGYGGDLRLQPDTPALPHAHQEYADKLLILGLVKSC